MIKELTQKYENVQKGIGDIMRGPLIDTEARRLRDENARKIALKLLKRGKLTVEEIAEDAGLTIEEIKQLELQLAEPQTV